jgi:hypothetical protein
MKSESRPKSKQSELDTTQQSSYPVFDPETYRSELRAKLPSRSILRFHMDPNGPGNLEYIIAEGDEDLSRESILTSFTTAEERAYQFMNSLLPLLFLNIERNSFARLFLKHTMQSPMGTHCIFGLQYQGFEIEEHSFVVHVDSKNHVVMISCTYLPTLPELLRGAEYQPVTKEIVEKEIKNIKYENAEAEKLLLIIWDEQSQKYIVAPGSQVKLSLPNRNARQPTILGVTANFTRKSNNSPGLADKKAGLGEIVRNFLEANTPDDNSIDRFADDKIIRYQAILLDLESRSELIGRYAAIRDEIDNYNEDKNGIYFKEGGSTFDRVTAYYHLDYIQRYFREKLSLRLLDEYPHLNPARIVLKLKPSAKIAEYDVNKERIFFYQLESTGFTAVRDPRFIYHEFLHAVTDALARLHRGDMSSVPRSRETLQAQAMDEGTADYFACSLAEQQGAKKALFYFIKLGKWMIERNLESEGNEAREEKMRIQISNLEVNASTWRTQKYRLGELWGRYLWQLRKSVGAEVADMLIAQSLFFLTRWASFEQGFRALQLADRLLFSDKHQEAINKIEIIESEVRTKR